MRYLPRRLGDDAAEDAAAEVSARAFRRADVVELPSGSPLPWLYGFAANVITERRRAETRRLRALERLAAQPGTASSDPESTAQLDPDLMRALRDLKQVDRETLLLVAWGELTYEQTAQALDVPIGTLLEDACEDLLGFYAFPKEHWPKLRSTNPLERVNKEIGRRSDVVGIYPNDQALIRLAGMLLVEQNDEWLVQRRYLSEHSIRLVLSDTDPTQPITTTEKNKKEVAELAA